MDIAELLTPVTASIAKHSNSDHPLSLGNVVNVFSDSSGFPDLDRTHIALIGVQEDRNTPGNTGSSLAPDYIRQHLFGLFQGAYKPHIADLGNIQAGNSVQDTYFAVRTVVSHLLEREIIPVIMGGGQDLTYANFQAYEALGQIINIVSVDSRFDIGTRKDESLNHHNYLSTILTHKPNYLFSFANIGYQTYFVDQDAIDLMDKLFFDVYRLGAVRQNLEEVEPVVRNADLLSFDISSVRQSDAPGNANASPNGFYGEEACQIARYAGLSDKLTSIGFYELNPAFDRGEQSAHLLAQMIWYFIDGYYHRTGDFPGKDIHESRDFIKYVVSIRDFQNKIRFFKSKRSGRWWMEVPCPPKLQRKYRRHFLIPCSYRDYQEACQNEIPEKWWQVYQKFI